MVNDKPLKKRKIESQEPNETQEVQKERRREEALAKLMSLGAKKAKAILALRKKHQKEMDRLFKKHDKVLHKLEKKYRDEHGAIKKDGLRLCYMCCQPTHLQCETCSYGYGRHVCDKCSILTTGEFPGERYCHEHNVGERM